MAEIKTYGFLIGTEECIKRRNEIIYDVEKVKGFIGISPEPRGLGQVLLFDSLKNRNDAMKYFKGLYQTIRKIPVEIYVDEKYLNGNVSADEVLGDDDFGKMMKEILSNAREEGKQEAFKEFAEGTNVYRNKISEYVGIISKLENKIEHLEARVKAEKDVKETMKARYEKQVKELNKTIVTLEADIKRMEKVNQFGEDDKK